MRAFLGRVIHAVGKPPRHLISDKGVQFWPSKGYKRWCKRIGIAPRFGAVGKHGSIAAIERLIRTLKETIGNWGVLYRREDMRQALQSFVDWYNEFRSDTAPGGKTPDEVYFGRFPANRRPRIGPRAQWRRGPGRSKRERRWGSSRHCRGRCRPRHSTCC
jgi:transposase InsO family protein